MAQRENGTLRSRDRLALAATWTKNPRLRKLMLLTAASTRRTTNRDRADAGLCDRLGYVEFNPHPYLTPRCL
jgi:hypothetical protein